MTAGTDPSARARSDEMVDRLVRLARALQRRGLPISHAETIDAAHALAAVDVLARAEVREALRATLVKAPDDRGDFDGLFDRYFPSRSIAVEDPHTQAEFDGPLDLVAAIGGEHDLVGVAHALVDRYAGLDGDVRGERHHLQRVLRAADLAHLMGLALREDLGRTPDEIRARIEELKRLVADVVHDRVALDDDATDIEAIEFLNASRADLDRMRRTIRPLARQLAARLARRRQHQRSGRVDLRNTMRHSLSTGGVPFDVRHHRRVPHRPTLWMLCDISGSVAEFSLFTLTLLAALSAELSDTRSFVFVDDVDEITSLLQRTNHGIEPWQIMRNTNVIGATGHSDYGTVLERFWERYGDPDLRATSTIVVTGDARSNHRPGRDDLLAEIARRARAVYWLNPEPRREWQLFDSEMSAYARHCTAVFEVRDLQQLASCIERIV